MKHVLCERPACIDATTAGLVATLCDVHLRFIEDRRVALQRYMNRLAAHPVAKKSEALRVFLEAEGNLRTHPHWRALYPRVPTPVQVMICSAVSITGLLHACSVYDNGMHIGISAAATA